MNNAPEHSGLEALKQKGFTFINCEPTDFDFASKEKIKDLLLLVDYSRTGYLQDDISHSDYLWGLSKDRRDGATLGGRQRRKEITCLEDSTQTRSDLSQGKTLTHPDLHIDWRRRAAMDRNSNLYQNSWYDYAYVWRHPQNYLRDGVTQAKRKDLEEESYLVLRMEHLFGAGNGNQNLVTIEQREDVAQSIEDYSVLQSPTSVWQRTNGHTPQMLRDMKRQMKQDLEINIVKFFTQWKAQHKKTNEVDFTSRLPAGGAGGVAGPWKMVNCEFTSPKSKPRAALQLPVAHVRAATDNAAPPTPLPLQTPITNLMVVADFQDPARKVLYCFHSNAALRKALYQRKRNPNSVRANVAGENLQLKNFVVLQNAQMVLPQADLRQTLTNGAIPRDIPGLLARTVVPNRGIVVASADPYTLRDQHAEELSRFLPQWYSDWKSGVLFGTNGAGPTYTPGQLAMMGNPATAGAAAATLMRANVTWRVDDTCDPEGEDIYTAEPIVDLLLVLDNTNKSLYCYENHPETRRRLLNYPTDPTLGRDWYDVRGRLHTNALLHAGRFLVLRGRDLFKLNGAGGEADGGNDANDAPQVEARFRREARPDISDMPAHVQTAIVTELVSGQNRLYEWYRLWKIAHQPRLQREADADPNFAQRFQEMIGQYPMPLPPAPAGGGGGDGGGGPPPGQTEPTQGNPATTDPQARLTAAGRGWTAPGSCEGGEDPVNMFAIPDLLLVIDYSQRNAGGERRKKLYCYTNTEELRGLFVNGRAPVGAGGANPRVWMVPASNEPLQKSQYLVVEAKKVFQLSGPGGGHSGDNSPAAVAARLRNLAPNSGVWQPNQEQDLNGANLPDGRVLAAPVQGADAVRAAIVNDLVLETDNALFKWYRDFKIVQQPRIQAELARDPDTYIGDDGVTRQFEPEIGQHPVPLAP
ncbi:unnamed protein product [Amoebophrya sp. A120]|nr:unnamed protein product [Amoebophrya sp. A120]|eukprot:GSA120T00009880001.1